MALRNFDRRKTDTPCRWALGTTEPNPHTFEEYRLPPKICNDILDCVGNTPIVRINNITKDEGILCELLVKCEFLNPGGSVKDRIGKRLVTDLELSGRLKPGMKIVEPTSGNTGIGIALSAAVKGYPMVITMTEKMSSEKSDLLSAMGAEIIRTPTEGGFTSLTGFIRVAERIERENPEYVMPGQHFNPSNPLSHYDHTSEEIIYQLDGKLDYIVIGTGTGGQVTGLSRKLKEKIPGIKIIGVDPVGSIIRDPDNLPVLPYYAEGIGSGIVPRVCYTDLVDEWYAINDQETFDYARLLIKKEGLLVGGSAGTVFAAAVKLAKTLPADKRILVMIPDGVRNYMTKFLSDRWMVQNGFMKEVETPPVAGKTVRDLNIKAVRTIPFNITIREVIGIMKEEGVSEIPVFEGGKVLGAVTTSGINKKLVENVLKLDDVIERTLVKFPKILNFDTSLAFVATWLEDYKYAVVHDGDFVGVIQPIDLSSFLLGS